MTTLSERLQLAMKGPPKISQVSIAKACGIKPPSVSDWLSGRTKNIEGANLLNAAKHLNVTPEWLATGRGRMRPGPDGGHRATGHLSLLSVGPKDSSIALAARISRIEQHADLMEIVMSAVEAAEKVAVRRESRNGNDV